MAKQSMGGVTFCVEVADGKFVSGRVTLDVRAQCVRPKRIDRQSPLWNFGSGLLVEMFRDVRGTPEYAPGETLIPGVFVDTEALDEKEWTRVGREEIDPTKVEFPEFFIPEVRGPQFSRGEIVLPIDGTDVDQLDIRPTLKSSFAIGDICLYYLDMKELMSHEHHEAMSLRSSDLRFTEHRDRVYKLLGEDPAQSYYEMALKHGHDLRRFYE